MNVIRKKIKFDLKLIASYIYDNLKKHINKRSKATVDKRPIKMINFH